jgi:hypothetical protein
VGGGSGNSSVTVNHGGSSGGGGGGCTATLSAGSQGSNWYLNVSGTSPVARRPMAAAPPVNPSPLR